MSGEVQVLTDTYGRIFTQHDPDGDVRTAVVWVPGDSRIDWDDASDQELVTLLGKYGYNDALTIENNNVTINDNGETETLIWNSAAMDFTVDVDMFQNGAQNMFFRTVNDGSQDVTVLVDADGKAIVAPTLGEYTGVLFSVANNGTEIDTITSGSSISAAAVIQACGGSVNVTALDAGASVFLIVMGTHVQFCNADDLTTTPAVNRLPGEVIPVEGDLQVFRNESCTEYATGYDRVVFVRVNRAIGYGDATQYGSSGPESAQCMVTTPSAAEPDEVYYISLWTDWSSADYEEPFAAGTVVRCEFQGSSEPSLDNVTTVFE